MFASIMVSINNVIPPTLTVGTIDLFSNLSRFPPKLIFCSENGAITLNLTLQRSVFVTLARQIRHLRLVESVQPGGLAVLTHKMGTRDSSQ